MSDHSSQQAAPTEGAASPRSRRPTIGVLTPVNIVVMVDTPAHEFYRRPGRVADVISDYDADGPTPSVVSVTVVDTTSGCASTWRAES